MICMFDEMKITSTFNKNESQILYGWVYIALSAAILLLSLADLIYKLCLIIYSIFKKEDKLKVAPFDENTKFIPQSTIETKSVQLERVIEPSPLLQEDTDKLPVPMTKSVEVAQSLPEINSNIAEDE